MHDERADRLALAPKRGAGYRAGARGARVWQSGPVCDRRVDIVHIGNVDLPIFAKDRGGQVTRAHPQLRRRNLRADTLRAGAGADHAGPNRHRQQY